MGYALGVPLVLPSKKYMYRLLQLRGHVLDMRPEAEFNVTAVEASQQPFQISPMNVFSPDIIVSAHLVELASFYLFPGVSYFESLQGAVQALQAPDVADRSATMIQYQTEYS